MILTKSALCFARNTVDALKTIRMLRNRNIDIYFEQEDIHSLYESSEFMLSLICARAFLKARTSNGDCVNLSKIQIPSIINEYVMDIPMISKGNSLFMKDKQRLSA